MAPEAWSAVCLLRRVTGSGRLLRVPRRVRVGAGPDAVGVLDAPVAAVDAYLAATRVVHDLPGAVDGCLLGSGVRGRPLTAWLLHVPTAGGVLDHVTLGTAGLAHEEPPGRAAIG